MNRIMSCNGCRVLRKGCSQQDCELRSCLQWIESPQSQANATLFLAKFYGRAGLINLINAGPNHLRPEIFKSLLYEACGRIIDPIHGSVGLMSSGNWQRCQAGVEAVLQGSPVLDQRCDIRHLTKHSHHRLRTRHHGGKRSKSSTRADDSEFTMMTESEAKFTITGWNYCEEDQKDHGLMTRTPSQDSLSVETVEAELLVSQPILGVIKRELDYLSEIQLDLTLGLNPVLHNYLSTVVDISDGED